MTLVTAIALSATLCQAPQASSDVVARFVLDGQPAVVARAELAVAVARRHRRTELGDTATDLLVDRELVARAARAAAIRPTAAAITARTDQIAKQLEQSQTSLEQFLAGKRMTLAAFQAEYVAPLLQHEQLVMDELDLTDAAEVTPDLMQLWLRQASRRAGAVTDVDALPPDVVAKVGERSFGLLELGQLMLETLGVDEREKMVRRVVLQRLLEHEASKLDIVVRESDTRAELARRKAIIEANPRYRGVSYEEWLRATQHMTVEQLARSPQLVATVQQREIARRRWPDAELTRRVREQREDVLRKHGEQRRIAIVLLRAREKPDEIIKRSFEVAEEELAGIKELLDDQTWDRVAKVHTEDPWSKPRAGEIGAFFRVDPTVPEPILAAAFSLDLLQVSEPVRVPQGVAIVKVLQIRAAPDDPVLVERLRRELEHQLLVELLEDAKLEVVP